MVAELQNPIVLVRGVGRRVTRSAVAADLRAGCRTPPRRRPAQRTHRRGRRQSAGVQRLVGQPSGGPVRPRHAALPPPRGRRIHSAPRDAGLPGRPGRNPVRVHRRTRLRLRASPRPSRQLERPRRPSRSSKAFPCYTTGDLPAPGPRIPQRFAIPVPSRAVPCGAVWCRAVWRVVVTGPPAPSGRRAARTRSPGRVRRRRAWTAPRAGPTHWAARTAR